MNQAVSATATIWSIQSTLGLPLDIIQQYWQTLYMHDLLKYRMCDVDGPTWDDVKKMIVRMGKNMYSVLAGPEVVGEFMLENFTGHAAQLHFSMLPELGSKTVPMARWTMAQIFELTEIKTLYGLTPETNRAARIFNIKCGFKHIGTLPNGIKDRGKVVDGYIMVAEA